MKMPPELSTDQALRAENAELRARLEEAEEMLRAIRAGEVDALVVEDDAGPRIFTLQGLDAEHGRLRGEMLAQISDAVVMTDREDRITFLNVGAEQQYRVRSAEMLGRKLSELYTPHWPSPEAEAAASAVLEERGHWLGDMLHRTRDGRELLVESSLTVMQHPHTGEHVGVITAIRDITERAQASKILRARTDELETLLDMLPAYVWISRDADARVIVGNRTANEFVGVGADTNVSQSVMATGGAPYLRQLKQDGKEYREDELPLQRAMATGLRVRDALLHFHFRDGRRARVVGDAVPLFDEQGRIRGGVAVFVDVTERERAEELRHETERNYRALAAASSEVAYRMSADWSTMLALDGRQLVASSDQQLADWAWLDLNLPPDEHPRVRQAISEAINRKALFELEHRVRRPDGSIGWTFSRAVPILDENEGVIAWFGAASDITSRKQAELNLTHAIAVAEKASRAKSDFLAAMSHELRTPLNAILGFAQIIEIGAPAPTPAQKRNLDQILKGGWYLLDLINELLDLALIESGKLSLTPEPVSLAEVMLECQVMFEPQARERGMSMTFPSIEAAHYVRADRTRVKQVLINLLSNAIKYNRAQGAVAAEWTLSPQDAIRISVRDTGEGLAPEKLAQLFQPFNRLGQEAGPQIGTGMGLMLTKRLVEAMGGAIGADSVVGVGSVFWFELKLASAPQSALLQAEGPLPVPPQELPKVPPQDPRDKQRTLLHVKDTPSNQVL